MTKQFKQKLLMIQSSGLFMHMTSLSEVTTEMQADDDKKFIDKIASSMPGQMIS